MSACRKSPSATSGRPRSDRTWTHRQLILTPQDAPTHGGSTVAVHPLLGPHVRLQEEPERHVWQAEVRSDLDSPSTDPDPSGRTDPRRKHGSSASAAGPACPLAGRARAPRLAGRGPIGPGLTVN